MSNTDRPHAVPISASGAPNVEVDVELAFAALAAGEWEAARTALEHLAEPRRLPSGQVLEALAYCLYNLGSIREAGRPLERAFAAFLDESNPRKAAQIAIGLVSLFDLIGEGSASRGWEQRALRLIEPMGRCPERGYLALALVGCEIHDPRELAERAEFALEIAREFGDHELELRALGDKGLALVSQGWVTAGFALLDEVMVAITAGEISNLDTRGKTICNMLSACERTGDVSRAEYWCRRIENEAYLSEKVLNAHCLIVVGAVDALRGNWESAEQLLLRAIESGQPFSYHRAVSASRLADLRIRQGRYQDASAALQGFEDHFETLATTAHLRLVEGDYEQARVMLRTIIRMLGGDSIRLASVLALLIEVELHRNDVEAARSVMQQFRALDDRCESNEIRALMRLAAGRIARSEGDQVTAQEELETALALLIHYERPALTADIRLELAYTLASADEHAAALVEAEAALAIFRRLRIARSVEAAEALRERLMARRTVAGAALAPAANREPAAGLTKRESEIAALVADGLTNREIAERLVLSVRTVETHVDRALGKLDLHTRTQLALRLRSGER